MTTLPLDPNSIEAKQENARRRVQEILGEYARVLRMLYDTMNDQFIAKPDTLHTPMGLTPDQMRGTIGNLDGIEAVQKQVADLLNTLRPGTVQFVTHLQPAKEVPASKPAGQTATTLPTEADIEVNTRRPK